jgi:hypothetical protein
MILFSGGKWSYVPKETGRPLALIGPLNPADPNHPVIFRDQSVQLHPGDAIFQYTDGVTEANDPGKNLFGEQRLIEAISAAPSDSGPQAVINSIRGQLKDFQADAEQFDDITMLCLFYHG